MKSPYKYEGKDMGWGMTYFKKWKFSINEGRIPNAHLNLNPGEQYFYLRFFPIRFWWIRGHSPKLQRGV